MPKLTTAEWRKVNDVLDSMPDPEAAERFGLPERRERSLTQIPNARGSGCELGVCEVCHPLNPKEHPPWPT